MTATALAWQKHGLIFQPDPSRAWMRTHAAVPVPMPLHGSICRVYFSGRDERNRSHVGYFDTDLDTPGRIVNVSADPVVAPGPPGHYDADGVYAEGVVRDGDRVRLYTIGVTTGATRPLFYAAIGASESLDGGTTFTKLSDAPLMNRSHHDPCLVTAPFVLREGTRWRMWYVAGTAWTQEPHGLQSHYHVKYAESADGLAWRRENQDCIVADEPDETNIARLWVVNDDGRYRGWFSASGRRGYHLGYAESPDGVTWTRADHLAGLSGTPGDWDSDAQAYPAVVRHGDRWFLFYNGNAFGRDGVGLASAPVAPLGGY